MSRYDHLKKLRFKPTRKRVLGKYSREEMLDLMPQFRGAKMVNFYELQASRNSRTLRVVVPKNNEQLVVDIDIRIDRGGRIIDCTRCGTLFDRLVGRQFVSINGNNSFIEEVVADEVTYVYGE